MLRINLILASSASVSRSISAYVAVVEAVFPCEMLVLSTWRHIQECYSFVTECIESA
jgi:hypothetical protein